VFVMDVNSNVNGLHSEPGFRRRRAMSSRCTSTEPISKPSPTGCRSARPTPAGGRPCSCTASGTSDDPQGYGQTVARKLFPDVMPYVVGTPAAYGFVTFNGRTLADNAPEAMLSLVTNMAVPSGLKPSVSKQLRRSSFPYVVPA
jgi:hypothetical protein